MGVEQLQQQRKKKKKKGRPSLLDLQKRHIKEQQQELQHYNHHHHNKSKSTNPNPSGRRSTRRNPIIDPSDSDESNSDDDDDDSAPNQLQKKKKPTQQLNRGKADSDEDEELERSAKKRKINAIADGSGIIKVEKLASGSANSNGHQGISVDDEIGTVLPDEKLLAFILDRLQKKDTYGVYSEPVDPDELPDYHEVIKHPMDFSTVRRKLDEGAYANLEQFENDVFLISSNAMQYNAPDTVYFRQAKSIHELAEKSFDNLRRHSDDEEQEPKVVRRGRPPTKHLKKTVGRPPFERAGSELTSGANLATPGGESTMCSNYDLRKGSPAEKSGLFDSVGRSHFIPGNSETNSSGLFNQQKTDRNDDYTGSQLRGGSYKQGKKPVTAIDHRRDTYKQFHPSTADNSSSVFKTFDEEKKLLLPVGLHAEYGYARSLARFSAGLGPVAWSIASQNMEKSLPPDVKFGPGWVGHNDVYTQRPLINPSSSGQLAASDAFSPPSVTAHSVLKLHGDKPAYQQEGDKSMSNHLASTSAASDSQPATTSGSILPSSMRPLENAVSRSAELNRLSPDVSTHLQQSSIGTVGPRPPLKSQEDPIVYTGTGSLGMKYYQPLTQVNMQPQTSQLQLNLPSQMNQHHPQFQMQLNRVNPQAQMNQVNPQPQMNQVNPQLQMNQVNVQRQMSQPNPPFQMSQRNVQPQLNHYAGPPMQLATGLNPNYLQTANLALGVNTDVLHSVARSSSASQSTNFFLTNQNMATNHSSSFPASEAMAATYRIGHHPEPTSQLFGQQQRQESVPPDLNVRFQSPGSPSSSSRMDSKQPDLALQL